MENQELLAKKAEEIINKVIKNHVDVKDTQIRNFLEAAKKSTNYLELKIFLQYQYARMKELKIFIEETLGFLDAKYGPIADYESRKNEIAYLFGLMARYKKFKETEEKAIEAQKRGR